MTSRPEQAIHRAIVQGLRAILPHGWLIFHPPSGIASSRLQGGIFKGLGTLPGYPDLIVHGVTDMVGGERPMVWFLEVKAPKGSVSSVQRDMHDRLQDLGFPVGIVRSWEDVVAFGREHSWPMSISDQFAFPGQGVRA